MGKGFSVLFLTFFSWAVVSGVAKAQNETPDPVKTAIESPDRSEEDRARDEGRKPGEVLAFFGIQPGQQVLDVFAGMGYYTEILAHLVGPQGRVVSHNDWLAYYFYKDHLAGAYQGRQHDNVLLVIGDLKDLAFAENSFDSALMILSFHDMFWSPENIRPEKVDVLAALKHLKTIVKPGGVVGIIDHSAPEGMLPDLSVEKWHRVGAEWVKNLMAEAGFELEAEGDFLRNPGDPKNISVFAPEIRGKTDRFVLRFKNPDS